MARPGTPQTLLTLGAAHGATPTPPPTFPPARRESRWHGFRSGLNVASQPSLASLLSTSLLRNKYLYLAPAFSQGLEAPAVKVHAEPPIPLVPSRSCNELALLPLPLEWGPEMLLGKQGSSWFPGLVMTAL